MEECVFISQLGFISEHVSMEIISWLCFTEKEHFLPVFTEKGAIFQHILRDAKSTKLISANYKHLWERAIHASPWLLPPLFFMIHCFNFHLAVSS